MTQATEIKIPGYRIEKLLGKGGMATVYLATQMSLGRPVALKVLEDPDTPQFFERFFRERVFTVKEARAEERQRQRRRRHARREPRAEDVRLLCALVADLDT